MGAHQTDDGPRSRSQERKGPRKTWNVGETSDQDVSLLATISGSVAIYLTGTAGKLEEVMCGARRTAITCAFEIPVD